jgi:hypothetical protein
VHRPRSRAPGSPPVRASATGSFFIDLSVRVRPAGVRRTIPAHERQGIGGDAPDPIREDYRWRPDERIERGGRGFAAGNRRMTTDARARALREPRGMETMAPSTSYLAPSFAHATVGDAMRPWVLTCDPATPLVTAADVVNPDILQVHADERLSEVAGRMARHGATHALVVDPASHRPIGILSTLDIARVPAWGRA